MVEISPLKTIYGGQFIIILTLLIKSNYLVILPQLMQHHSFFRNLSRLFSSVSKTIKKIPSANHLKKLYLKVNTNTSLILKQGSEVL